MANRLFVIITLVMITSGCDKRSDLPTISPDEIRETNEIRKELGIRQIKDKWQFDGSQFDRWSWKSGGDRVKSVLYDKGKSNILIEFDFYYTGTTWTDHDGQHWECLVIIYDYSKRLFYVGYSGINAAINVLFDDKTLRPGSRGNQNLGFRKPTNLETLQLADEILEMLGEKRL